MKILILILSFTYAYGQSDSTQWETVRVFVGVADTVWNIGSLLPVNDSVSIQFRSNGAVVQRREIYHRRKE